MRKPYELSMFCERGMLIGMALVCPEALELSYISESVELKNTLPVRLVPTV